MADLSAAGFAIQATQELRGAAAAVHADDEAVIGQTETIRRLVSTVTGAVTQKLARAAQLNADDLMNVAGKQRLLAALPAELVAATTDSLEQAELLTDIIEGVHIAALFRHDSRQDANLRAELDNYTANLKQSEAAATLASLAGNPRYSTFLAGPMGESLMARYGIRDPEFFRRIALEALALDGTAEQLKRSAALQGVEKLRRVIGLAKGARDAAIEEVRRTPAPKSSAAIL